MRSNIDSRCVDCYERGRRLSNGGPPLCWRVDDNDPAHRLRHGDTFTCQKCGESFCILDRKATNGDEIPVRYV